MPLGLIGRKLGMTRIFDDSGLAVPITVVAVESNRVIQVKEKNKDGYCALQVAAGRQKPSRVNKPKAGHFAKAGVEAARDLWEFVLTQDELNAILEKEAKPGMELTAELFQQGQFVDVAGMTKGKGFAGAVKRHHFACQDATHGNSLAHRAPGSIGQNQSPRRVFKGKKMAGRMGGVRRTMQNVQIFKIDKERQLLMIRGALPGAPGGCVLIKPAVKKPAMEVASET